MIKWTFFFNEGNVISTVDNEAEDLRITESLDSEGILDLPTEKFDLFVNMSLVKCTTREVLDDDTSGKDTVSVSNPEVGSN